MQHLELEEVEDMIYGNKLFSRLMLVLLVGAYAGVTILSVNFGFML